jgi:hypothetical protein
LVLPLDSREVSRKPEDEEALARRRLQSPKPRANLVVERQNHLGANGRSSGGLCGVWMELGLFNRRSRASYIPCAGARWPGTGGWATQQAPEPPRVTRILPESRRVNRALVPVDSSHSEKAQKELIYDRTFSNKINIHIYRRIVTATTTIFQRERWSS